MPEEKPRVDSDSSTKIAKKITLPDGFRVGIVNLDSILNEVADLKLVDPLSIREELLKRAEVKNYIPSGAKTDYATALYREYQLKYKPEAVKEVTKTEGHKHTRG